MLLVIAMLYGVSTLMVFLVAQSPSIDSIGRWAMRLSATISLFVVLLTVATLMLRAKGRTDACLIWTKAFNIFLLLVFPFGTIAGIYGLWKVDKA
jgi:hypothetical protein